MDDKNLNEEIVIDEENLNDISGGSFMLRFTCDRCKKVYNSYEITSFKNRTVCTYCKKELENQ